MDETLKALRAAYYLLLTVCATLVLFGVSTSTTTPYRRALREVDALQRIPWSSLRLRDSLNAFVLHRPGRGTRPEDTLPLAEVLVRSLGPAQAAPGGRRLVTLPIDRILALDTLYLLDRRFEFDMAGARSDGPGTRVVIAAPPEDAPLDAYEKYLRDNPPFQVVTMLPIIKVSSYGDLDAQTQRGTCARLPRPCVLHHLQAMRDSVSGQFQLLTKLDGLGDGVNFNMDFTFRTTRTATGLRLADWLARYSGAARLLQPSAQGSPSGTLAFLPALKDEWPELHGLTLGQARLLLTSKIRAEQPVRILGLEVPASAIALAAPAVLLALLAHLGLLVQHLRSLMRAGAPGSIRQFPLPLLFPGRSGAAVAVTTSLVFPALACLGLLKRLPMEGFGRVTLWVAVVLVLSLGVVLALRLFALRRDVGGYAPAHDGADEPAEPRPARRRATAAAAGGQP